MQALEDLSNATPGAPTSAPGLDADTERRLRLSARRNWLAAGVLIVALWGMLLLSMNQEMDEREATVRYQAERLANALQMQTGQMLDSVDIAMSALSGYIAGHAGNPSEIERILLAEGKRLPPFFTLAFINAQGLGVAASLPDFKRGTSFADRDYFRVHLDLTRNERFIGGPLVGRTFGKQFFAVSRRVESPDGRFLGVLMGSVEPQYFASIFSEFPQGPNGAIAMAHIPAKKIVARAPNHDKHFAQDIAKSQLFSGLLDKASGLYEVATTTDGVTRIIAYHQLKSAPFVVLVGYAREDLRAEFAQVQRAGLIIGLMVSLLIASLAMTLTQAYRRTIEALAADKALAESRVHEDSVVRESEALLNRAQTVAQVGSWHLDIGRNVLEWSAETCHIFGVTDGKALGYEDFLASVHPDDRATVDAAWQAALQGAPYDITHRIIIGDTVKWVREQAELTFDTDGKLAAGLGTVQDVSALKHIEEKLLETIDEQTAIFESATHGIAFIKNRVVLKCNHRLEEIFGYGPGELIGQPTRIWYLDEQTYQAGGAIYPELAGGRTHRREEHVKRKDGSTFWCRLSGRHIDQNNPSRGTVWLIEDVTVELAAREQLNLARQQAEAASKAKSEFLANMSHEIRTPMNAILGLTQLVLDTPLQPRQKDFLERALNSGQALLGILNDILDYSKIEAGRLEIEQVPFSIEATLRAVSDLFSARLIEKGLSLYFDIAPGIPASVIGDPLRLHQILANLVGNAIKFTSHGEIWITVAKAPPTGVDRSALRFTVRDTGVGFDGEVAQRLFQPFMQADNSITREYGGTGLGLAICYRLVTLMGGEITAAGTPGEGATFTFSIVVGHCSGAPQRQSARPEKSALAARHFQGARVLLAEDNATNRLVATELLKKLGVAVTQVNDGAAAVAAVERERFAAVLMDLHMPVMDGLEATRRIRALPQGSSLTVIALTAAVLNEDRERCQAAGMNDFIPKPINMAELANVLARHLPSIPVAGAAAPATPAAAIDLAQLTALLASLSPYLEERDLVPDKLLLSLDHLVQQQGADSLLARLVMQINNFDHDGALATIAQITTGNNSA